MTDNATPCDQPEALQFDFWLGDWDLTWGEEGRGTNRITKILDGCVIQEEFDGASSIGLKGLSVSTFNTALRKWQQTWVDNSGGYLDLVGEFSEGRMVLFHNAVIKGKAVKYRMVFYDITENEFDWSWERAEDGEEGWKPVWQIHYVRRSDG